MRGNLSGSIFYRGNGHRSGIYLGRRARALFSHRRLCLACAALFRSLFFGMPAIPSPGQTVRRLFRRAEFPVREGRYGCQRCHLSLRARALRGNARGAEFPVAALFAATRLCRTCNRPSVYPQGYDGDFRAQFRARARASRLYFRLFGRRTGGVCRGGNPSLRQRSALCVHERLSRRARTHGCGAGNEAHRPACGDGFGSDLSGGDLHFVGDLRGGRRGFDCGNAVFVRHAGKQALLRCRRACNSYLARFGDLSHAVPLQSAERQKKERRKAWSSPCGVVAVRFGNRRNRPRAVSRFGLRGNNLVSSLHFL